MVRRKLEWKLHFRALPRSSAEEPSIVVAIGTSRLRCSMVQKRKKKKEVSVWLREVSTLHHQQPSRFEELGSKTWCRYRFALHCFRVRGCTAAGRSGCTTGTARKSSHPWHFRCSSPRRNDLERINLVTVVYYWSGERHCTVFSSRDAIMVVGFVLEKHVDGNFTPDQEKEITFKRWPPGCWGGLCQRSNENPIIPINLQTTRDTETTKSVFSSWELWHLKQVARW